MKFFSWGANSHGQLGQGSQTESCTIPTEVRIQNLALESISVVLGGGCHSLLLDKSGRLYGAGWNNRGQLGMNQENALSFQIAENLQGENIEQLACGWDSTIAINKSNSSFLVWGSNVFSQLGIPKDKCSWTNKPLTVPLSRVKQVSMGLRHTAVVTEEGKLFVCGNSNKGQLGLQDGKKSPLSEVDTLTQVPELDNVKTVACGQHHTIALTRSGSIFVWGDNRFGQLGFDPIAHTMIPKPRLVSLPKIKGTPENVFAGWTHTVLLTDDGEIVNWGRNTYGQLGSDSKSRLDYQPNVLCLPHIKQLAVGSEHNTALADTGDVLSWGWNEHGNCGNGSHENVWKPDYIFSARKSKTLLIGSGACQSFALVEL